MTKVQVTEEKMFEYAKEFVEYTLKPELIRPDHLVVLFTHTYLEFQVNELIKYTFKDKGEVVLKRIKNFSEKLNLVDDLDYFDKNLLKALRYSAKIRNEIAHDLKYVVDKDKIGKDLGDLMPDDRKIVEKNFNELKNQGAYLHENLVFHIYLQRISGYLQHKINELKVL